MTQVRFCPGCVVQPSPEGGYCQSCGRALSLAQEPIRYRISPTRLAVMTVLSFGTYLFYWFYLTWKQYRDHTGELVVYPVWHALALWVPIYNLFRAHHHMQSLNEMMLYLRAPTSIRLRHTILLVFLLTLFLGWQFYTIFLDHTFFWLKANLIGSVLTVAIAIMLLADPQRNLNRYWMSLPNASARGATIGVGEVVLAIAGSGIWAFLFGIG